MPKRTIYIPKDLDRRYQAMQDQINLSELLQLSLTAELNYLERKAK